jgi:hypothetical protein
MLLNLVGFLSAAEFFAGKCQLRSSTFIFLLPLLRSAGASSLKDTSASSRKSGNDVLVETRGRIRLSFLYKICQFACSPAVSRAL